MCVRHPQLHELSLRQFCDIGGELVLGRQHGRIDQHGEDGLAPLEGRADLVVDVVARYVDPA